MLCLACSKRFLCRMPLDYWHRYDGRFQLQVSAFSTTRFSKSPGSSSQHDAKHDAKQTHSSQNDALKSGVVKSTYGSSSDLPSTHVSDKVKQAGKDVFYTGIVLFGIGVTGIMGYAIFRELMSSKSPNGVYSDALKLCKKDVRVKAILGEPLKAYGELSSRGRRRHIQSAEFLDGNAHIVQIKFYMSGPYNTATVYVEKNVSTSSFRNLIFQTDDGRERFSLLTPAQSNLSPSLFS